MIYYKSVTNVSVLPIHHKSVTNVSVLPIYHKSVTNVSVLRFITNLVNAFSTRGIWMSKTQRK